MRYKASEKREVVGLRAKLTHLMQPRNDPSQAKGIASFSGNQEAAGGSVFDAMNDHFWIEFRCKSTQNLQDGLDRQ